MYQHNKKQLSINTIVCLLYLIKHKEKDVIWQKIRTGNTKKRRDNYSKTKSEIITVVQYQIMLLKHNNSLKKLEGNLLLTDIEIMQLFGIKHA